MRSPLIKLVVMFYLLETCQVSQKRQIDMQVVKRQIERQIYLFYFLYLLFLLIILRCKEGNFSKFHKNHYFFLFFFGYAKTKTFYTITRFHMSILLPRIRLPRILLPRIRLQNHSILPRILLPRILLPTIASRIIVRTYRRNYIT